MYDLSSAAMTRGSCERCVSRITGKERDSETGLDYFGARYYGSNMGRFMTPDEYPGGPVDLFDPDDPTSQALPYANILNPQSLNKYSYTYNNPLRYVDPDGHCLEDACVIEGTVALGVALYAYTQSPAGQQVIRNGLSALGSMATSIVSTVRNPWGSKGAPDHQEEIRKQADKAQAEAGPGETVLTGQKVRGIDSNRQPDVQVVGADGKTKTIVEVERKPESKRHKERQKEYDKHKIPHKTIPLPKRAPKPENQGS